MAYTNKGRADRAFDAVNIAIMVLLLVVMLYPIYFTVIASFSEPYDVVRGNVYLWPVRPTVEAYKNVLETPEIWVGYRNTIFYVSFGTLLNLALTIPCAYVLSKKGMPLRNFLAIFFLITMYFSGGLIPTYLLVKSLGLINSPLAMIVLGGVSVYNVIVARVFFESNLPGEIFESARIDGANDFCCFFRIALPLSAPILAVMALYYAVARWNNYFDALIYITDSGLFPLQMVLRNILLLNKSMLEAAEYTYLEADVLSELARRTYLAETMKYALIFISSLPLLVAYPFVQKYFVKGMMIGSLKG